MLTHQRESASREPAPALPKERDFRVETEFSQVYKASVINGLDHISVRNQMNYRGGRQIMSGNNWAGMNHSYVYISDIIPTRSGGKLDLLGSYDLTDVASDNTEPINYA